jgi:hypothetical protein
MKLNGILAMNGWFDRFDWESSDLMDIKDAKGRFETMAETL